MRPIIGIVPLYDLDRESIWMPPDYMKAVEKAGGLPIILDLTKDRTILSQEAGMCQGFLFTGGEDINPDLYNEPRHENTGRHIDIRDDMEAYLMHQVLVRNKPLLGICRGHQMLNVVLGGSLYQDLPTQRGSHVLHRQSKPYHQPIHSVEVMENTPLHALLAQKTLLVNSLHHQGINRLASRLEVMAKAEDDMIEAVYDPTKKFVWVIQWHPELAQSWESSRKIFGRFVDSSRRK